MHNDSIPVLIVGGGPVGLTASLLLARFGIRSLLIERHAGTSIHPRARGLNVRTMEIYRTLGLEERIRSAGMALAQSRYMLFVETLAGHEIRRVPDEDLITTGENLAQFTPCNWCQCAQDELEPILLTAAQQAGADIQFATNLTSFTQDETGITAEIFEQKTGKQRTIHADYMLAADGANSSIRRQLGTPISGRGTLDTYINIYFRADLRNLVQDRWFSLCFVENASVEGIFLAVNNTDRWLFNVPYSTEEGKTPDDFTPDYCISLIRHAVGLAQLDVEILSVLPWEATARIADQFQTGRIFLAGDAAHQMPPAGGFGLNTGVQDVHNLAWKLAEVLRGAASATLLETYHAERHPVAQQVVDQATRELDAPTPDTTPVNEEGEQMNLLATVLGYRYKSAAIVSTDIHSASSTMLQLDGQPGTRMPHIWIAHQGKRISTLDLSDTEFVLLVGTHGDAWRHAAKQIAHQRTHSLVVYQFDTDVLDLENRWHDAYGITPQGAVLIRPDGFIAWRAENSSDASERILTTVLDTICGRPI